MNRREMITAGGASLMLLAAAGRQAAEEQRSGQGLVIDTLCLAAPDIDFAAARRAGMNAALCDLAIYPRAPAEAEQALEGWAEAARANARSFEIVRRRADLTATKAAGKFGIILGSQDAAILGTPVYSVSDENLDRLRHYHRLGLRVLQLTHNERNGVGDGFRERVDAGLSLLGEAVVAEMNRIGMLIDLSHCSDATTNRAIARSRRPVAVTHAGCRSLYTTRRNKSDETIRLLADRGGYFGVFMMSRWLTRASTASVEDVVDHIEHAVRIGGVDLVGFGSDQPILGEPAPQSEKVAALAAYQARNAGLPGAEPLNGHVTCPDLDRPDRMTVLAAALARRGHRADSVDKILGGNFARVFGEAVG